jgi:hypothetical protein
MLFQVNGFSISNLQKSGDIISVDIIANHLTEDTEKETILKDAFSPETVKEFLDIGVVEFWHESRNPILSKKEKNEAIIGKPVAFRWENGLPVVTANLTKGHAIVQTMLPHLEAKQPVYAASVGGAKMVLEVSDSNGSKHRVIPRIKWDHLAIAPSNAVINRAPGMNVRLLQKANDIMCEFDDMSEFAKNANIMDQESVLMKALMAPASVSDLSSTPGGAITKQDLEGAVTFSESEATDLLDTIIGIKRKKIPLTKAEYIQHFEKQNKKDFGSKSFMIIDKYFKSKKER